MAQYNQNIAEQFLEPEKLPVGWPWRLLLFSVFLFALILFIYLGMIWGYQPYLAKEKVSLNKQIDQIGGTISQADRDNFVNFYSQLINLQGLLENHVSGSSIFDFLERNTNQQVYFNEATVTVTDHFLRLGGVARSYDNLVSQMVAFEQAPETARVVLEQSQVSNNGISFLMDVYFKPMLLNSSQNQ